MDAYRDQYATLFNNGKGIVLLAISGDSPAAQAAWASDSHFPFRFLSDSGHAVAREYGVAGKRAVFVIRPDGTISYVEPRFNEIDPTSYTMLGDAIQAARKGSP
jgi:thioredoxin-dependent peroxiredoxin